MKKTIAFLLSLFSCVTIINAQEMCSTPSPEPPQWIFNPSLRSVRVNKLYRINIFVHIVRSGNDKGASPTIAPSIINDLNGAFANARIQLYYWVRTLLIAIILSTLYMAKKRNYSRWMHIQMLLTYM